MTERFKNIVINFIKENWEDTNILYNIEKYTQDSNSLDDIGADSLDYANFVMVGISMMTNLLLEKKVSL